MTDAEALLREAEQDTSSMARVWRLGRIYTTGIVVILCLVAPLCFLVPAEYVAHPVVHDDSGIVALSVGGLLLILLPLSVAIRFTNSTMFANSNRRLALAGWVLRRAATSGNDELMPLAVDQPVPAVTDDAVLDSRRFKSVRWLDNDRGRRLYYMVGMLAMSIQFPFCVLMAVGLLRSWSASSTGVVYSPPAYIEFLPVLFVSTIVLAISSTLLLSPRTVSVDDDGLSWKAGLLTARRERIAWSQVCSFVKVSFRNQALFGLQTAYVLDAGAAILQWGYDPTHRTMQNEADAKRLAALVAQHTGLPLRDATPLAKDVAKTLGGSNGSLWAKTLAVAPGAQVPPRITGLAEAFDALAVRRGRFWLLVGLACVPALVYGALSVWAVTRG